MFAHQLMLCLCRRFSYICNYTPGAGIRMSGPRRVVVTTGSHSIAPGLCGPEPAQPLPGPRHSLPLLFPFPCVSSPPVSVALCWVPTCHSAAHFSLRCLYWVYLCLVFGIILREKFCTTFFQVPGRRGATSPCAHVPAYTLKMPFSRLPGR